MNIRVYSIFLATLLETVLFNFAAAQSISGVDEKQLSQAETIEDCLLAQANQNRIQTTIERVAECASQVLNASGSSAAPTFKRPVAIKIEEVDTNAAWTAQERAKIGRVIKEVFEQAISNEGSTKLESSASSADSFFTINLSFRPASYSQRTLDQWVNLPKRFQLIVRLRNDHPIVRSEERTAVIFSTGIGLRNRLGLDENKKWFRNFEETIRKIASDLTDQVKNLPPIFETDYQEPAQVILKTKTVFRANSVFLMIPENPDSAANLPIAQANYSPRKDRLILKFLRGTPDMCRQGCLAFALK